MTLELKKIEPRASDEERHHSESPPPAARTRRSIRVVAVLASVVAIAYVLYQRVGTTAQADLIEFTPNLAGGFLAVGMTDTTPGFILLSSLDRESVDVSATHYRNAVAGDFTVAEVRTQQASWHRRLRGPVVVVVESNGGAKEFPIDWSVAEFRLVRDGADCAHPHIGARHRCGAPFADLFDLIADGRLSGAPHEVRRFLAPHARPRDAHTDRAQSNENARAVSAGLGG